MGRMVGDRANYGGSELMAAKWDSFSTQGNSKITHKHILKLLHDAGKGYLIPKTDDDDERHHQRRRRLRRRRRR